MIVPPVVFEPLSIPPTYIPPASPHMYAIEPSTVGKPKRAIYNVVDAEGHILKPVALWPEYMDPAFRDRAPKLFIDKDGARRLRVGDKVFGDRGTVDRSDDGGLLDDLLNLDEKPLGDADPDSRISAMAKVGIDAEFLYPRFGFSFGSMFDPQLAAAMCRAHNRWLADYCRAYPNKLFGVAMLPLTSVEEAIREMRFARKELGMLAGFIRPAQLNSKMLHDPDYERFWSEAEALDFSIGIYEGATGLDPLQSGGAKQIVSRTMEMMLACMSVIWGGVCERHPKIRIAFLIRGRLDSALARQNGPTFR